jgi:hypothetical protein
MGPVRQGSESSFPPGYSRLLVGEQRIRSYDDLAERSAIDAVKVLRRFSFSFDLTFSISRQVCRST